MKKILTLCLALLFLLCAGCGSQTKKSEKTNPPTSEATTPEVTDPAETTEATEPITHPETQPQQTQPEEIDPQEGYIERIPLADQSIFSEPSYDSSFVGVVGKATNYTIVEEATDDEGNLWGKLKSGLGWVDLTEIRSGEREKLPVTANFADDAVLDDENTIHFIHSPEDYAIRIAFRPNQTVRSFTLSEYVFAGEDFEFGKTLYTTDELTPETPLVAALAFSGDFTMYAITYTEEDGTVRNFYIGESGRNGTIYMTEIEVQ